MNLATSMMWPLLIPSVRVLGRYRNQAGQGAHFLVGFPSSEKGFIGSPFLLDVSGGRRLLDWQPLFFSSAVEIVPFPASWLLPGTSAVLGSPFLWERESDGKQEGAVLTPSGHAVPRPELEGFPWEFAVTRGVWFQLSAALSPN